MRPALQQGEHTYARRIAEARRLGRPFPERVQEPREVEYSIPGWGISDEDYDLILQCYRGTRLDAYASRLAEARRLGRPAPIG